MQVRAASAALGFLLAAAFLHVAESAASPAGPIDWHNMKVNGEPPYPDGTAVVGDTVHYVWMNMEHGVVLSTSPSCNDKAAQMAVTGGMDATNGNVAVTFTMPGTFYVICPVGEMSNRFPACVECPFDRTASDQASIQALQHLYKSFKQPQL